MSSGVSSFVPYEVDGIPVGESFIYEQAPPEGMRRLSYLCAWKKGDAHFAYTPCMVEVGATHGVESSAFRLAGEKLREYYMNEKRPKHTRQ